VVANNEYPNAALWEQRKKRAMGRARERSARFAAPSEASALGQCMHRASAHWCLECRWRNAS
jgi:hypothetical protein